MPICVSVEEMTNAAAFVETVLAARKLTNGIFKSVLAVLDFGDYPFVAF